MSVISTLKTTLKKGIQQVTSPRPLADFSTVSLPWIDKPGADIKAFVDDYNRKESVSYDLVEKLTFWRQNGYVVLEQAIPHEWLNQFWGQVETMIEHHERYKINVRLDLPEYAAKPVQPVSEVPQEVLNGPYVKFMDFHDSSLLGKQIMLHNNIITFLQAVFNDKVVAMQSLLFKYGSQQPTHQDFPYVVSEVPSHLAASWIAIEDIHIDSGPLYYYPGSHHTKKFDFGNTGILFNGHSKYNPVDFAQYLERACTDLGLERKTLLIKKGDVLIWHAALAHGGDAIRNASLTRKSYVCHYSSGKAYKHHRQSPKVDPIRRTINGADVFVNPLMPDQEDIF